MKIRIYSYFIIALSLSAFGQCLTSCKGDSERGNQPNIIFILADDLGWADLPLYGNKFNEAPNISLLAEEGMRFDNAYAACPVCSPTRASIQSGQYPARVGITDFIVGHWRPYEEVIVPINRNQKLPLANITIAEKLKEKGYSTAYYGKWHLGWNEDIPTNQGYDEQAVYNGGGFYGFPKHIDPPQEFPENQILSEALTDLSISFIERNKDNPFFLFLAHYDVHVQLDAQQELIDKYLKKDKVDDYTCNAVYAAMIENIDRSVGRIESKISELGLEEETMVIFFSDNGGLSARFDEIPLIHKSKLFNYEDDTLRYIATSNKPLRGEKGTVYEGGIREPLIVKWPGKIKQGSLNNSIVSSVDFYPTFLDITGITPDPEQKLDGISMMEILLSGEQVVERPIFWHYPVYHHGVPASVVRKGDYKLIENLVDGSLELYNLKTDISEKNNLTDINPQIRKELYGILKSWQKDVKAEFPRSNPDFDPSRRFEWGKIPSSR